MLSKALSGTLALLFTLAIATIPNDSFAQSDSKRSSSTALKVKNSRASSVKPSKQKRDKPEKRSGRSKGKSAKNKGKGTVGSTVSSQQVLVTGATVSATTATAEANTSSLVSTAPSTSPRDTMSSFYKELRNLAENESNAGGGGSSGSDSKAEGKSSATLSSIQEKISENTYVPKCEIKYNYCLAKKIREEEEKNRKMKRLVYLIESIQSATERIENSTDSLPFLIAHIESLEKKIAALEKQKALSKDEQENLSRLYEQKEGAFRSLIFNHLEIDELNEEVALNQSERMKLVQELENAVETEDCKQERDLCECEQRDLEEKESEGTTVY